MFDEIFFLTVILKWRKNFFQSFIFFRIFILFFHFINELIKFFKPALLQAEWLIALLLFKMFNDIFFWCAFKFRKVFLKFFVRYYYWLLIRKKFFLILIFILTQNFIILYNWSPYLLVYFEILMFLDSIKWAKYIGKNLRTANFYKQVVIILRDLKIFAKIFKIIMHFEMKSICVFWVFPKTLEHKLNQLSFFKPSYADIFKN